jgi:hypothetical protein
MAKIQIVPAERNLYSYLYKEDDLNRRNVLHGIMFRNKVLDSSRENLVSGEDDRRTFLQLAMEEQVLQTGQLRLYYRLVQIKYQTDYVLTPSLVLVIWLLSVE